MNDDLIRNEIETFLEKQREFDFSRTKVFVHHGSVLLVGNVLTGNEKRFVENAVGQISGVNRVVSKLELLSEAVTEKLPPLATLIKT